MYLKMAYNLQIGTTNLKLIKDLPYWAHFYIITLLSLVCFYSSANGGFVFDDLEAVVNNDDVKLSTPIKNIFRNDFWGTPITYKSSHKSYRPFTVFSFRLNAVAANGELVAFHFHLVNIVLYSIVCCLSLLVLNKICGSGRGSPASFIAAVIFTVHPVHSEPVASVVGRADLLCAIFMFTSFLVYTSSWNNNSSSTISIICTTCTVILASVAMLTKEQGLTILAICGIYDILILLKLHPKDLLHYKTRVNTKLFVRHFALVLSTIMLLCLRWMVMDGTVPMFQTVDNPASFMDNVYFRVTNYIYIYALNVWLLICPEWLCFDWSMGCVPLIESFGDIRILFVVLFTFLCGTLVFSLSKTTDRQKIMALSFILVPFLPATNIFFRVGFVIAERTLLVPSLGFCLIVAIGMQQLTHHRIRMVITPCLVFLVTVFCCRSHLRTTQWSSERVLFWSALKVCPLNAKVHYNIAKTTPNKTEALERYKEALRLNPTYDQAMNNLANLLKGLGQVSEAESLLYLALKLRPEFPTAWMNLGIVLSKQKRFVEAEKCYKNAISYRRKYTDCYYNLGNMYLELKDYDKAYHNWEQATKFDPKHHGSWNNMIIMLDSLGKHEEASSVGEEALAIFPNSSTIHFNIANAQGKLSKFIEAEKHFKTAIDLNPDNPLYYVNLGVLYHHWKKLGLAEEMYRLALKLEPNLKNARKNLRLLENLSSTS